MNESTASAVQEPASYYLPEKHLQISMNPVGGTYLTLLLLVQNRKAIHVGYFPNACSFPLLSNKEGGGQ